MEESDPVSSDFVENLFDWAKENLGADLRAHFANDDWTLIVKLHALVETALNTGLVKEFQSPELAGIIGRLGTSNPATGKVAFAKALQILRRDTAAFIQKLSELRNFCVHDIRNFTFSLDKYVSSLDRQKRSALLKVINKQIIPKGRQESIQVKLMAGTMAVMMEMHLHDLRCQTRELEAQLRQTKAERFDAQNPPNSKEK